MAVARTEDQIFFIYDHSALTCEEDDLKDAIIYFFPSSISVDSQCALAGQIMGMVEFFKSFSGSAPSIFTLERNKIAIKNLGRYTLALSGNRGEPDGVVLKQLTYLHNLFVLYQGSLASVERRSPARFSEHIQDIWDCYLPFVRRYGDNIAAAFESLPVVDLPETGSMLFLKASHLLQECQKVNQALVGCILYRNRVLCSQYHPDLTARLLIIKPNQAHFPCLFVETDTEVPPGVRLLTVFLTCDEKDLIHNGLNKKRTDAPPRGMSEQRNPPRPLTEATNHKARKDSQPERSKKRTGDLARSRRYGSMDWNNTVREFRTLTKDTVTLGTESQKEAQPDTEEHPGNDHEHNNTKESPMIPAIKAAAIPESRDLEIEGSLPKSTVPKCHSDPELSNVENVSHLYVTEKGAPTYGRQVSRECEESNILCVEPDQSDGAELCSCDNLPNMTSGEQRYSRDSTELTSGEEILSAETSIASEDNKSAIGGDKPPGQQKPNPGLETTKSGLQVTDSLKNNPNSAKAGRTISLLQNIKRITAQSRNILEGINKKFDLNADMKDTDDEDEPVSSSVKELSNSPNQSQQLAVICDSTGEGSKGMDARRNVVSQKTPEQSIAEVVPTSPQNEGDLTSSDTTVISSINLSSDADVSLSPEDHQTQGSLGRYGEDEALENVNSELCHNESSQSEASDQVNTVGEALIDTPDITSGSGSVSGSGSGSPPAVDVDTEAGLETQELYIQGCNELVLLLLMERGQLADSHFVSDLWHKLSPQLRELEAQLNQISSTEKETRPIDYNYLTYNSYTKNLTGKISMKHGMLQPMSHHELDFCGTAVAMHQEFTEYPNLVDMTMRSHSTCVYGHRNLSQEMFFQPKECKAATGIPSVRDHTMCLDARTCHNLLKDQGIHLI